MTVTPDVIGVIVAVATLVGGLFGGIWALMSRQTIKLETRFDARFDRIDARLERMDGDITELKIAVARLEGPPPRLVMPR